MTVPTLAEICALAQEPEDARLWWLSQMPSHVRAHAERMMGR